MKCFLAILLILQSTVLVAQLQSMEKLSKHELKLQKKINEVCSQFKGSYNFKFKLDKPLLTNEHDSILIININEGELKVLNSNKTIARFNSSSPSSDELENEITLFSYNHQKLDSLKLFSSKLTFDRKKFQTLQINDQTLSIILDSRQGYHCTNHNNPIHTCSTNPAFASPRCITLDCVWARD